MLTPRRRGERGQTVVIFAVFLVVLIGSAAIAVDYGSWLKSRRDYQNVVDAASLAGSVQLTRPVTVAKQIAARQAAWKSIEDQLGLSLDEVGLANAGSTPAGPTSGEPVGPWRIWVSTPPLGGSTSYAGDYAGSNRVVYVWIERNNEAFFSRVFGLGDRTVSAWATSGTFPNRFAVITLRKNGNPTSGNPTDLDINGGTVLNVFDGDVGGNWGLSINGSTSAMVMHSATGGDSYGAFFNENVPTGGNGWTPTQVRNQVGTPIPVQFHPEVTDPAYPAPCGGVMTYSAIPATPACLEDRTAVFGNSHRTTSLRSGDTCVLDPLEPVGPANDRLPTGRYNDIRVDNGECLIFDPTFDQKAGRVNGIVYITGTLDLNNGSMVLGDGVTLVFARGADFNANAGATVSLNSGNTTNNPFSAALCGGNATGAAPNNCKYGGWTVRAGAGGNLSWGPGISTAYAAPTDPFERGIATYVCKSAADCDSGGSASTNILQMNSGSGIDYRGLIYAPWDNVKLAGQPNHQDIGQLVCWTAQFTGGTEINQTFDGPDSGTPVLLEPHLGQ